LGAHVLGVFPAATSPFLVWFGLACALWWDRRIGLATAALAALNGALFVAAERLAHVAPSIPGYHAAVDDPLPTALFFTTLLATFAFAPLKRPKLVVFVVFNWEGIRLLQH